MSTTIELETVELETEARRLRAIISRTREQLNVVEGLLNKHYAKASGLIGRMARSARVPGGIKIEQIEFKTWDPGVAQSVSGFRSNGTYTTIHLTSPGFQIYDANTASNPPQQTGLPGRTEDSGHRQTPAP